MMEEMKKMGVENLCLHDAFNLLTNKRLWHEGSAHTPQMARKDKYLFDRWLREKALDENLKCPIPESRIRDYLKASGANCVQEEKWKLNEEEDV